MASNRRRRQPPRRRDNKTKSPNPKTLESSSSSDGGATATADDVPDHVLEIILLRLDSYVSLVRAASACKRWCRVTADAGFLSRFHPLPARAPLILGYYYYCANYQQLAFAPSSTPSIRERSRQSLSLDFVPKIEGAREIADSRGTLLLLSNSKEDWTTRSNPDLVVCRPLTRRYQAISVPERLTDHQQCLGLFLVEGGGGGGIGLSNFRVMAVLLRDHMLVGGRGMPVACVYSPWTTTTTTTGSKCGWRDVSCTWSGDIDIPNKASSFFFAGRANGCLYWPIRGTRAALVLDEAPTGVSLVDLPVAFAIHTWHWWSRCFRVVGGDGEDDGAVSLRAVHLSVNELRVYARLHVGDEWVLQNLLPLPVPGNTTPGSLGDAVIVAAHETYVVVTPLDSKLLFSVDLKTMAVECVPQTLEGPAYPYELPWPPTLDLEAAQANTHNSTSTTQLAGCSGSGRQTNRLVTLLYATVFSVASKILGQ